MFKLFAIQYNEKIKSVHTLGKLGWVVIDICQSDVDSGGARETSDLACHVFCLDNHSVMFSGFSVHVS